MFKTSAVGLLSLIIMKNYYHGFKLKHFLTQASGGRFTLQVFELQYSSMSSRSFNDFQGFNTTVELYYRSIMDYNDRFIFFKY